MIKRYFQNLINTLKFHCHSNLLIFWCISDVLNNQVLWTDYSYWVGLEQGGTYWLYMAYLILSLAMLVCLNNFGWLIRFITAYLILTLFSSIRYIEDLVSSDTDFDSQAFRALLITIFYVIMWSWIWFKIKREMLYKKLTKSDYEEKKRLEENK